MKKFLAAILMLIMVLSMVSCVARPEMDLEEAKDNLEDEDYRVSYTDDEDDLDAGYEEMLMASKDDDYLYVVKFGDVKSAKLAYEELKLEREAEIDETKLEIKKIEHLLKKYERDLDSDEIDEYEDELKELEDKLDDMKKEFVYGRSGKVVWYGTADAIDASKGK